MQSKPEGCLICGRTDVNPDFRGTKPIRYYVECPDCGQYTVTRDTQEFLSNVECDDPLIRKRIARYLYNHPSLDNLLLTPHPMDTPGYTVLDIELVKQLYTDDGSPLDKYEGALVNFAKLSETFGHEFSWAKHRWEIPTMYDDEAKRILDALKDGGYLFRNGDTWEQSKFSLTLEGLRYAAELRRQARASGNIVFVAACFKEELIRARETICEAVKEWGYDPKMVDCVPGDKLIDLKIYDLIRASRFVVADLTHNRQSVYYEIGFAHGLSLQVVYTCRSSHLRRVHFDVSHRPILKWKDEEDLAKVLRLHLRQEFPRGPGSGE